LATWQEIATENETAAKELNRRGLYRSAVSRAYYSAYAAVLERLVSAGTIADRSPSHKTLPVMVEGNVPGLSDWKRRDLKAATRRLYEARLQADYRATTRVDARTAFRSMSDLALALGLLRKEESR
jgi:uncharacterized protein (UPF0332 family)